MIDILITALYLITMLAIGIFSGSTIKNIKNFSVGKKNYSSFFIFATLSASFIGGGYSMGNASKVFTSGLVTATALIGFSLSQLLIALFIAPKMNNFKNAISIGDIMERPFGKMGKIMSGIFAIIVCAGILGAQMGAIGYIFELFLGIPYEWGILIGCGIVIVYSTLGGIHAVIMTDVIQFSILIIAIPLLLVMGISHVGGISAMINAVPVNHLSLFHGNSISFTKFISLFFTFLIGEVLVPPYLQRLLLSEDVKKTRRGTLASTFLSVPFFFISGMIGLVALAMNPSLESNLCMPYVINEVLPIGLKGFVIAGMISIVMSSADSFLNSASVSFTHDIVTPLMNNKLSDKRILSIARVANIAVGMLAILFSLKMSGVLDILIYAYSFWSPIILVPLILVLIGRKVSKIGFITAACCGVITTHLWNHFFVETSQIDGIVIGVLCNLFLNVGLAHTSSFVTRPVTDI